MDNPFDPNSQPLGGGGQTDLTRLIAAAQANTIALNNLNQTIAKAFPSGTGTSASASGGAATLPTNPVGFITTTLPGTTTVVKIPYFT